MCKIDILWPIFVAKNSGIFKQNIHKFLVCKESEEPKMKMRETDKGSHTLEDKDTNIKTDCKNNVIHILQYSFGLVKNLEKITVEIIDHSS